MGCLHNTPPLTRKTRTKLKIDLVSQYFFANAPSSERSKFIAGSIQYPII